MIHRLLFEGQINIRRRTYVWNMLSSMFYSVQSALFLLVATRVAGEAEAGSFIILFTVAQTLNTVGNYNIRDFQVSDVREEYSFPVYLTTRLITCAAMLALAAAYCFWKHLSSAAATVMICLAAYRLLECLEDVFHGAIQRAGRFDVTSICMTSRIILSSVGFCVVYILSGSQVPASLTLVAVCAVTGAYLLHVVRAEFSGVTPIRLSLENIPRLLTACFPIFIGAFLYTYLINVPKYAIADLMNAEAQTIFNILFMPAFVINILSMIIFKPLTVKMSLDWNDGNYRRFGVKIAQQTALVIGLTASIVLAGDLIGLRLLALLYGVDLAQYRVVFALLLLFGGISAMSYFANMVLTIIRAQIYTIVAYLLALTVSMLVTRPLIHSGGIQGAALAYGCICTTQMLVVYGVIMPKLQKRHALTRGFWKS